MHSYSSLIYFLLVTTGHCCFVHSFQLPSHNHRRQMNTMRSMAEKAYQHGLRINQEALCAKPRAELVYLTDNNKIYLPRATLLHRCSDLTGCCAHATHSCQPSQVENVSLYFFTISVQSLSRIRQQQNIEKINFVNHTECACMPVDHGRSESLRQNETSSAGPKVNTLASGQHIVVTNDDASIDDGRAVMYNGDLNGSEDSDPNNIDIHNGNSGDTQNGVLKYWGKLLGLYKTKVYRDVQHTSDSIDTRHYGSQSLANKQPTTVIKRMDTIPAVNMPRPLPPPVFHNPPPVSFVPYQSSYMYLYPSPSSQYKMVNGFSSNQLDPNPKYQLAYRRLN